ncbi:MAG: hypothetical protein LBG30_07245 [Odoribacteraceae bacterium]|nr:hypothetical protein [Odoribacteraceae bacterium]
MQEFKGLIDPAERTVNANKNLQTRNKESTARKNAAMRALLVYMRELNLSLRVNKKVSDADLGAMGLPSRERHYHAPKPAPGEKAVLYARVTRFAIKVSASVPQDGRPSESVTRPGYHGLLIRSRVEGEDWREVYTTRVTATLKFAPEQVGKTVEIIAAWINPRLEHGPWGDTIRVIVG